MFWLFYWFIFVVALIPIYLLRVKIFGKKNMPKKKEKCLVASNHFSMWDPMIFHVRFGRRYRALAKKELFNNWFMSGVMKTLGGIPVDREKMSPSTYKAVMNAFEKDKQVLIFPEGTRNKTETTDFQEAKNGVIIFASKADVPIVPVVIYRKPKLFRKNYMIVGEPFKVEGENPKRLTKEEIEANVEKYSKIMADLRKQLDEKLQKKNKKNKKKD